MLNDFDFALLTRIIDQLLMSIFLLSLITKIWCFNILQLRVKILLKLYIEIGINFDFSKVVFSIEVLVIALSRIGREIKGVHVSGLGHFSFLLDVEASLNDFQPSELVLDLG